VTPKPVRYVVDSHYHYDHAHGNQVFMRDAQVIGHDNTRRRMLGNVLEQFTYLRACQQVPTQVAALKSGLRRRPTRSRKPRSSARLPTQWRTSNR
jgi:glyoxylase-like metal-dependent hydrolase (beta-lactamase superfamily II)